MRSTPWILGALLAACGGGGGGSNADAGPDARVPAGLISLSWTVSLEGSPSDCAAVGNPPVTVRALPTNGAVAQIDTFSCSSMMGTTRPFPVGTYDVTVRLGDLDESEVIRDVAVEDGRDSPLGQIAFDVTADATLQFRLEVTGASGSNCDPQETPGGAGITGFLLELYDSSGTTCMPVTFDVGGESYASDCLGATFRCIEEDETVQVTGLLFGSYRVRVQGFEGDTICYPYDAALTASTSGTVSTIPLAVVDPTPDGVPDGGAMLCGNP